MVKCTSIEEAIKALYAVSALIQNNLSGQELFYAEAGDTMLQVPSELVKVLGVLCSADVCMDFFFNVFQVLTL